MHGHWLKGYLRDGKEIEGDGGSGGGALIVALSGEENTADKTFGEIAEALSAGRPVFVRYAPDHDDPHIYNYFPVYMCAAQTTPDGELWVAAYFDYSTVDFADSQNTPADAAATDYPRFGAPV